MLIIIEGMDKVGKTTVAEHFRQQKKFEYVHMTAPAKWHTRESYFAEMLHIIALTAGKNVVIDRSWCGELVWPFVFNRDWLLSEKDCEVLTETARTLHSRGVQMFYMNDPDEEGHLARIKKFKEPSYDFSLARELYSKLLNNGFTSLTFNEAKEFGWT